MDTKSSERIKWLDTARTFAIMLVILCHVTGDFYFFGGGDILERSVSSQLFGFILFTFGRLSVPLFLFISGYLLLPRQYDNISILKFWKRNLLPLFIASEIWIVFYYSFICYFKSTPFSFIALFKNMLFLGYENVSYLWYLSTIIGLYIFIPFAAITLQRININIIAVLLFIPLLYCFFIPTLNILFTSLEISVYLSPQFFLHFSGGVYGFYIIIGYFFQKQFFKKKNLFFLMTGLLSCVLLTALFQMALHHIGHPYTIWYDFILLPFASMFLFSIVQSYSLPSFLDSFWIYTAKYSFGIYLVHKVIQNVLEKYMPIKNLNTPVKIFIIYTLTFLISLFTVSVLSKIPVIRKYLFLIKQ